MSLTHAALFSRVRDGRIYVTPNEEGEVRCLPLFLACIDPRLQPPIGWLGSAEVWVREWEPSASDEEEWIAEGTDETFAEWTARKASRGHAFAY